MKKCKADFIAKKYPTWIDILDELPKKKQYVEWLSANGQTEWTSIRLAPKDFLDDPSQYGVRYWRKINVKKAGRERKEVRNEK